jgi:hypothetical protein
MAVLVLQDWAYFGPSPLNEELIINTQKKNINTLLFLVRNKSNITK